MKKFLMLVLLVPTALAAQTRTIVSGYVAADAGIAGDPLLVGGTVARETGPLAARLGIGFDISEPPVVTDETIGPVVSGILSSDADVLLFLGNPRGSAALIPYGVAGVGVRGYREDGSLGMAANYSYGGGFRAPLGAGFSMEGELRQRSGFAEPVEGIRPTVASGLEYRFGMSVGFGGSSATRPRVVPPPLPVRPSALPSGSMLASADASMRVAVAAIGTAERYIGVPYLWGGNSPDSGFDCSGFIRYVYNLNGVTLPRVSRDQARHGTPVPLDVSAFLPGDILAFSSTGGEVDHTAIYAGGGRIIHSSSSGRGVRYDDLYSQRGRWFLDHMVAARRVIEGGWFSAVEVGAVRVRPLRTPGPPADRPHSNRLPRREPFWFRARSARRSMADFVSARDPASQSRCGFLSVWLPSPPLSRYLTRPDDGRTFQLEVEIG